MQSTWLSLGLLAGGGLGFLLGARGRGSAVVELLYPLAAAFFAGFVFSTLVPDALTHSRGAAIAFAAGALGMGILSKAVWKRDPCCEGGHDHKALGAASLAAMAICSVNDGLLIGLVLPPWGSGLNLGMLLHKVTSSFAIAQVLLRGGYGGKSLPAFGLAYALVSPAALLAAASPAAASTGLVSTGVAGSLPGLGILSGASAGVLAYVTLTSLAPHAGGILRRRPAAALGFGAALLLSLGLGFWHRGLHGGGSADHDHGGLAGPGGPGAGHGDPADLRREGDPAVPGNLPGTSP